MSGSVYRIMIKVVLKIEYPAAEGRKFLRNLRDVLLEP